MTMKDSSSIWIGSALEAFLCRKIARVYIAHETIPPPAPCLPTNFSRLSVIFGGEDIVEIVQNGKICAAKLKRGDAIFVPANAWIRPVVARHVKKLSLLFRGSATDFCLVHPNRFTDPDPSPNAYTHLPLDGPVPHILKALTSLTTMPRPDPIGRLLIEAVLHSCLHALKEVAGSAHAPYNIPLASSSERWGRLRPMFPF